MHIIKGQTPNFNDYKVFAVVPAEKHRTALFLWLRQHSQSEEKRIRIFRVIEADEASGRVVQQVCDDNGDLVFTNGLDEVSLTNEAKILFTVPDIYTSFIKKGYVPKTIVYFRDKLEIEYNGPQISQTEKTSLKAVK